MLRQGLRQNGNSRWWVQQVWLWQSRGLACVLLLWFTTFWIHSGQKLFWKIVYSYYLGIDFFYNFLDTLLHNLTLVATLLVCCDESMSSFFRKYTKEKLPMMSLMIVSRIILCFPNWIDYSIFGLQLYNMVVELIMNTIPICQHTLCFIIFLQIISNHERLSTKKD